MSGTGVTTQRGLQCVTAYYSFLWLLLANLVGLWLAVALVWPSLGQLAPSVTYGRLMPLHMDWQLYGWCSLPLVGLLFSFFIHDTRGALSDAHLAYIAWSGGLFVLGLSSLSGYVSGKLFLNFAGPARVIFPAAQVFLWGLLAAHSHKRYRQLRRLDFLQITQLLMLAALAASPLAIWASASPDVYPPIDPESGGATGHSLVASTLGMIFIFGLLPQLLRVPAREESVGAARRVFAAAYLLSLLAWGLMGHGNASNTARGQILGFGVLIGWGPVLVFYYRAFVWPPATLLWRVAFLFWWAVLTFSGFVEFLPGVLDIMKYTNGFVAHAHLAMAGMVSAFNMLILGSLGQNGPEDPWHDVPTFWFWNVGTGIYVVAMSLQGVREGVDPTVLIGNNAPTHWFYMARLGAGGLMLVSTLRWVQLLDRLRQKASRPGLLGEGRHAAV